MSLGKNIFYNVLLTVSLYVLQFATYPYVSRTLGVDGMGVTNFAHSVVQYFMMLSMLGVNTLGTREIARCNGDPVRLRQAFSGIFQLNMLVTLVVLAIYLACIALIPRLWECRKLLWVGAFQVLFNALTIEWLYKGLEEFRYITFRTLFVRLAYVPLVFCLVRGPQHYALYFQLTVGVVIVNGLINILHSRRFVHFKWQALRLLSGYFRHMLLLGSYAITTMMYVTFNVIFLGFVSSDYQVGIYTTATKLHTIIVGLYTAFTTVMMSRMSALYGSHDTSQMHQLLDKSFQALYAFAIPVVIACEVYAREIVLIVSGPDYLAAVPVFRILVPLIFIVGMEQIFVNQGLMPRGCDKIVLKNSVVGLVVGLSLNFLLVRHWQSIGSAIVWLSSEMVVLFLSACHLRRITGCRYDYGLLLRYATSFLPLLAVLLAMYAFLPAWVSLAAGLLVLAVYSHIVLFYVLDNSLYKTYAERLLGKFRKR